VYKYKYHIDFWLQIYKQQNKRCKDLERGRKGERERERERERENRDRNENRVKKLGKSRDRK
jgi:hypothetical protein